ncbi:hypothetical protein DE167_004400 [Clostridium beijerinckii]|uniref:Uncharacterized protein n=1 Tax=Clostridium beijerinckii TaxID=1520 RepID=A0AAX0B0J4_CLOBE|nr:hypothetical protein [Clostridium beijerinckii]NRT88379.1 hypothetical protein [Clostridium beijerinckii]NYC73834.1 hypothetical protein [Clostridium beijerinckii]
MRRKEVLGDYDLVQRTVKEFMDAYRKAKERI